MFTKRISLAVLCAVSTTAVAEKQTTPPVVASQKPKATRIAVSIDKADMSLTIPPKTPAFLGDERWTHMLAVVATEQGAESVILNVALVPKNDDRTKITNEQVVRDAKLKQKVTLKDALTIEPGKTLDRALFGASPPTKIVIRWVVR